MIVLAVVLGALAAIGSGVGTKLQHDGVRAVGLPSLKRLGAHRSWRAGLAVLSVCSVLQVVALALAPVIVVAPLVVLALPVAAVLGKRLDQSAGIAVGAVALSIAFFVALFAGNASENDLRLDGVFTAAQLAVATAAGLVLVAVLSRGVVRCAALSAAAGANYGLVSVLIRDITFSVGREGFAGLSWMPVGGAILAFAAAAWLVQLGHASGPPDLVVGCQTAVNPLVATTLGLTVLGESSHLEPGTVLALAGCAVIAVGGIAVLARHHVLATSSRRRVRYSRST